MPAERAAGWGGGLRRNAAVPQDRACQEAERETANNRQRLEKADEVPGRAHISGFGLRTPCQRRSAPSRPRSAVFCGAPSPDRPHQIEHWRLRRLERAIEVLGT
jgi:hypothetical protein